MPQCIQEGKKIQILHFQFMAMPQHKNFGSGVMKFYI